jgi:hypothetical protein
MLHNLNNRALIHPPRMAKLSGCFAP